MKLKYLDIAIVILGIILISAGGLILIRGAIAGNRWIAGGSMIAAGIALQTVVWERVYERLWKELFKQRNTPQ